MRTSLRGRPFSRYLPILFSLLPVFSFAQNRSPLDSLELFHPIYESEKIRRVVKEELSTLPSAGLERLRILRQNVLEAQSVRDTVRTAYLNRDIADLYFYYQQFETAIDFYTRAAQVLEKAGDTETNAFIQVRLFHAYRLADLVIVTPLARFPELVETELRRNNNIWLMQANRHMRIILEPDGITRNEAIQRYYNTADSLVKVFPDDKRAMEELARASNIRGNLTDALFWARKAGNPILEVFYSNNLGDQLRTQGRYAEALSYFAGSKKIAVDLHLKVLLRNTYENMARVYWHQNDFENAFKYRGLTMYLMENLWSDQAAREISRMRIAYETEKKEWENRTLQRSLQQQKREAVYLTVSLGSALLLLSLVWYSRRRIKQGAEKLAESNARIEQQNTLLADRENQLNKAQVIARTGSWSMNFKSGSLQFSNALPVITGLSPEQLSQHFGSSIAEITHPDDRDLWLHFFANLANNSAPVSIEFRTFQANGLLRWFRVEAESPASGSTEVSGTIQDITEMKAVEQARIDQARTESFTRQLLSHQDMERSRIAAELHDGIGQEMLIIKNNALLALAKGDVSHVHEISDTASRLIENVRTIIYDLRPVHLDKLGITETVLMQTRQTLHSAGINLVEATEKIDGWIPKNHEIHVFRMIQEITNNAVKHSRATEMQLAIKRNSGTISIELADNGIGLPEHLPEKGLGLTTIRQRAHEIGAELRLNSSPKGTCFTILIPISEANNVI